MITKHTSFLRIITNKLKAAITTQAPYAKLKRPLNIAHRGLAALFPENTIPSFQAALYSGADCIQIDVVLTKDDHLLVMHDPYLRRLTNIQDTQLKDRKVSRYYCSEQRLIQDGWTDQFTLQQLKRLTVKQNQAKNRITSLDWHFGFSTLDQVIQSVKKFNKIHKGKRNPDGHIGGIMIEAKDGDMYRSIYENRKVSIGKKILDVLKEHQIQSWEKGMDNLCPIYLQSFDSYTVQQWHNQGSNLPRNLLIEQSTHPNDVSFLQYVQKASKYAHGVGLQSVYLWDYINKTPKYEVIKLIRQFKMLMHIWTFKDDDMIFDAKDYQEMYHIGHNILKLDGIITQFPHVYAAISKHLQQRK